MTCLLKRGTWSVGLLMAVLALPAAAVAAPCTAAQWNAILAPATETSVEAVVDCDLTLTPLSAAAITRRLVFLGAPSTGRTLDCGGGVIENAPLSTIEVRSREVGPSSIAGVSTWERVSNVTIRNCELVGSVRIMGMASNGEGAQLRASSRVSGHVSRARAAAPSGITLDGVTIRGIGRIPLYIAPGVQGTTLIRSHITGTSSSVAVYLDAESTRTTLRDNEIDTNTTGRELVAIDASSHNRIISNRFSSLEDGGIYLYRNCGEGGTIRITTPSSNEIINNVFYYATYSGSNPAVFLGARNGNRNYCGLDAGFGYGSSVDDRDFATENVVMQNQLYVRSVADMIQTRWPDPNSPNYVGHNTTVTSAVSRLAGCYVPEAYTTDFISHGRGVDVFRDGAGAPYCGGIQLTCNDGDLQYAWDTSCRIDELPFGCAISGSDEGCSGVVFCPSFGQLIGARAACNLEYGSISDAQLASVPPDMLSVVRASDVPAEGSCWLGRNTLSVGNLGIARTLRISSEGYGCREHDGNGGECHIRGAAWCYYP
ncbi:right-handed parallel beta-helix repeat-containing protein [Pyxidicoccus xibeiensis]|uniref:right-handed parallel beta-helix repeat-containing protein n=1 Tax=Pyxidicoccus xibeiensis TaxID=2906759 RepID=UPI0020A797E0|nr:right-handed parallel beta-helix repeat-containing protein [Pyxidicoccus xibeiensis]MCP3143524.1 right-handed parallel beta-helix repeat-containing protein [Pyxidicoccus xibeiensis]